MTTWAVSHGDYMGSPNVLDSITVTITRGSDWCGEHCHYTYVTVQLVSSGQSPTRTHSNMK